MGPMVVQREVPLGREALDYRLGAEWITYLLLMVMP